MTTQKFRVAKTYPENSRQAIHFEELQKYYGATFNEIFFHAAWAVLSPLADALRGTPARTIQRNRGACQHFIEAIFLEAVTQAKGEFDEGLPGHRSFSGEYTDMGSFDTEDDSDDLTVVTTGAPIPGDPFG